jgi:uncharacterized membrane protein
VRSEEKRLSEVVRWIDYSTVAVGFVGLYALHNVLYSAGYSPRSSGVFLIAAILYRVLFPALLVLWFIVWVVAIRRTGAQDSKMNRARLWFLCLLTLGLVYTLVRPPDAHFASGFLARMKSEIDPGELQSWASDLLKTHSIGYLETNEIPAFLQRVNYLRPRVGVGTNMRGQTSVTILYGGGFLGWGLEVGDTNLVLGLEASSVRWQPGIYAFVAEE